jgi:outer membrane lipoprotein-sorting protein
MRKSRRQGPGALALSTTLALALLSSSCSVFKGLFVKVIPVTHHGKPIDPQHPPLSASREDLMDRIGKTYNAITSFQATITMTPSVGSVYKGQITEIAGVRAYILFRKPADIRIQAQAPVVRTPVFDMVSNGTEFRLLVSTKNLFVEGLNSAPATSKNKIENLRPAAFLSSMLIMPTEAGVETPIMTDLTDEDNELYALTFVRKLPDGDLRASRMIWFDRTDLSIIRQIVFDDHGAIISNTRYANWTSYPSGAGPAVFFPAHIDIQRPIDQYGVVMDIEQMQMNKLLNDAQFVLTRPDGSQLQQIGGTPEEFKREVKQAPK